MSLYAQEPDYGYNLANKATTDSYQEFRCPGSNQFTLTVTNQAILYQIGTGENVPIYVGEPILAIPGVWIRHRRIDALRFKSASTGNPAVISIEAR